MIYLPFKPRQMMVGSAQGLGSGEYSLAALFNNSNGAQALVVRDYQVVSQHGDSVSTMYFQQWPATANPVTLVTGESNPMVPGDATLPGLLYSGSTSAFPNIGYSVLGSGQKYNAWIHDWPVAVLLPGWYFAFQDEDNTAEAMEISLIWQAIPIEYLDNCQLDALIYAPR